MTPRTMSVFSGAIALALLASGCHRDTHVVQAPPPPPPPPTAAPVVVKAPGPWGVYFDLDEVELKPAAMPILDLVVDAYRRYGRSVVNIDGHGDTVGDSDYNLQLGQRRAEVVKAYLVSKGVATISIRTQTDGERDLMVPTRDDVKERRNRRVEITFTQS